MDLTGKVIAILPEQTFKSKNGDVIKNGFVVEVPGQYKKRCAFSVIGADRWAKFGIAVGADVHVFFDISTHEWNGRWFNVISAYRVDVVSGGVQQSTPQPQGAPQQTASEPVEDDQPNDNLPF